MGNAYKFDPQAVMEKLRAFPPGTRALPRVMDRSDQGRETLQLPPADQARLDRLNTREEVFGAISRERDYQDAKYGHTFEDLAVWILDMQLWTHKAVAAMMAGNMEQARHELLCVAALAVKALEDHGPVERIELERWVPCDSGAAAADQSG